MHDKMTMNETNRGEPKVGRRAFLAGSTVAVAAAAIGPVTLLSGRPANAASESFSRDYFSDRAGEFFQVDVGAGGWSSLELVEVIGIDASPQLDQFTVCFRGSPNTAFGEGLYDVAPPEGDVFGLHIQPTGSDSGGAYYDATFALAAPTSVPEPSAALGLLSGAALLTWMEARRRLRDE